MSTRKATLPPDTQQCPELMRAETVCEKEKRRRASFRQKDLQRVLKATQDAGLPVGQIEVDLEAGKITITTGDPKKTGEENGLVARWKASRVHAS